MKTTFYLALDDSERNIIIHSLNHLLNLLIEQGKYTDAVDDLWFIWGLVLLPLAAAVMIAVIGKPRDTMAVTGLVLCFVQMALMIAVIIPTEMALRKKFDKDGNPR